MIPRTKPFVLGLCLAASAIAAPLVATAGVSLDIDIAPPLPRVEVVPEPRPGYAWAPGYWQWRGHEHVWVNGRWMHERRGYHWNPDRWEQRGTHWHREPGHWER